MNQEQLSRVKAWVQEHREEYLKDLSGLVAIPSVSEAQDSETQPFGAACSQALDYMKKLGEAFGLEPENFDAGCGQVWLRAKRADSGEDAAEGGKQEGASGGDNGEITLGIWGHLDVVPEGSGWNYPPFQATYRNGFLIGRGISDNKGPCVGTMYALRCLKELGISLPYSVALCYGTSEETGMDDIAGWTKKHPAPDYNIVADCGFPLCYGEKGILRMVYELPLSEENEELSISAGEVVNMLPDYAVCKLGADGSQMECKGRASHVINPEKGSNAIYELSSRILAEGLAQNRQQEELFTFLKVMTEDGYGKAAGYAMEDRLSGPLVGALTKIRTEKRQSPGTDTCQSVVVMESDYRYPILNDATGEKSDGAELVDKLTEIAARYHIAARVGENSTPAYFAKEKPFVQSLLASYREYTGSSTEPFVMSGGTYARKLPNAVAYGLTLEKHRTYSEPDWPEGTGSYHQANECLCLDELLEAIVIYCKALHELRFGSDLLSFRGEV